MEGQRRPCPHPHVQWGVRGRKCHRAGPIVTCPGGGLVPVMDRSDFSRRLDGRDQPYGRAQIYKAAWPWLADSRRSWPHTGNGRPANSACRARGPGGLLRCAWPRKQLKVPAPALAGCGTHRGYSFSTCFVGLSLAKKMGMMVMLWRRPGCSVHVLGTHMGTRFLGTYVQDTADGGIVVFSIYSS